MKVYPELSRTRHSATTAVGSSVGSGQGTFPVAKRYSLAIQYIDYSQRSAVAARASNILNASLLPHAPSSWQGKPTTTATLSHPRLRTPTAVLGSPLPGLPREHRSSLKPAWPPGRPHQEHRRKLSPAAAGLAPSTLAPWLQHDFEPFLQRSKGHATPVKIRVVRCLGHEHIMSAPPHMWSTHVCWVICIKKREKKRDVCGIAVVLAETSNATSRTPQSFTRMAFPYPPSHRSLAPCGVMCRCTLASRLDGAPINRKSNKGYPVVHRRGLIA